MTKPGVLFQVPLKAEPKKRTGGRQFAGEVTPGSKSEGLGTGTGKEEEPAKADSCRGQPGPSPAGDPPQTLTEPSSELSDRRLGQLPTNSRPPWLEGYPTHHAYPGAGRGPRDHPVQLCHADEETEVERYRSVITFGGSSA